MMIAVAGMVGTGKTTLARALARCFGFAVALESVGEENPWLPLFYGEPDGMRRYGLNLQLHFLATRMQSLRRMRAEGGDWILDRTWYEDAEIFARGLYEQGLLTPLEHRLYERLYTELSHSPAARPPRLMAYLHGPLELVVERVQQRGRPAEKEAPQEYWARLHARYRQWIGGFRFCTVLPLDIREHDLVADPGAVERVALKVQRCLGRDLEKAAVQYRLPV
ncbi:MAG: deoxynucleoside kinase [Gemmatimonadetes bacterium]|nr:deoxynucleoside kinase [Gemmatimonadota bacterium]